MFNGAFLQAADGIAWYWYVILVLVVLGSIVWWLFCQVNAMEKKASSEEPVLPKSERDEDDLTRIEQAHLAA